MNRIIDRIKRYPLFYFSSFRRSVISWAGLAFCSFRAFLGNNKNAKFKRIAIIQMGHLGDMIITMPLVSAFKDRFPQAEITLVIGSWCEEAVKTFAPEVKTLIYDAVKFDRNPSSGKDSPPTLGEFDLFFHIRGDLKIVIEYFRYYRTAFQHALPLGNDLRWAPLYLLGIPFPKGCVSHQYERFRKVLAKKGITLQERPVLHIKEGWESSVKTVLQGKGIDPGNFAVLHPGAPWSPRRWPLENYAQIAGELIRDYKLNVAIIGSAEEGFLAETLKQRGIPVVDLTGILRLSQLAALLKLSKLYVGNDSGPAHVASAAGAPVLIFYGPQEPELFGALSKQRVWLRGSGFCSPCWQTRCIYGEKNCMSRISVTEARQAIQHLIN